MKLQAILSHYGFPAAQQDKPNLQPDPEEAIHSVMPIINLQRWIRLSARKCKCHPLWKGRLIRELFLVSRLLQSVKRYKSVSVKTSFKCGKTREERRGETGGKNRDKSEITMEDNLVESILWGIILSASPTSIQKASETVTACQGAFSCFILL